MQKADTQIVQGPLSISAEILKQVSTSRIPTGRKRRIVGDEETNLEIRTEIPRRPHEQPLKPPW